MIKWVEQWAEVLALVFLGIGFILSILLISPFFSYLSVLVAGGLAARFYYLKRYREPILPFILIILGFLVGYLIGSFWVSRLWITVLFLGGFGGSYYLHLKKIFTIVKVKPYIK